jgi:RNA polymerase sigma-70 factor, ECF subfamily
MANYKKEFSKIYDQYIGKIYRFIFLKVSSEEIAQDLCSETFIKALGAFKQEKIDNPQAFLYKIAKNLVIDHYRDKGRTKIVSSDDLPIIDPRPSLAENAALSSDLEIVKNGISNLKEDYQNVIIWHYLDDLPICEVAKLLDRSEEATRVLLCRALESLRGNINLA